MKSIRFFLFLSLCLLSCQSQNNEMSSVIMMDLDNIVSCDFEIEDVEYVLLETTDASLLGTTSKILYRNNLFYVLDKMSNGVYVFDRKGKYMSSLMKLGNGPEEYVELMDMDVDDRGNIYIADNAKTRILKYRYPDWKLDKTFVVGKHYWEFCCLNEDDFMLKDVFGKEGLEFKLAHFDGVTCEITPIQNRTFNSLNELDVMKCSKFNLYRSGDKIYYNERFTPNIYSLSKHGELNLVYKLLSENYISESELRGLCNEPLKFLREKDHIKDIVGLYENDDYFLCTPFVAPSGNCILMPKNNDGEAIKINLSVKPELLGATPIEGVADGKFFSILKIPNEVALESDSRIYELKEDSNPILILFSLKKK